VSFLLVRFLWTSKENEHLKNKFFSYINFCLPKNESAAKRRKGQSFTWLAFGELPCAARNNSALRNSLRSNSPRAFSVIFPLLGCTKWHF